MRFGANRKTTLWCISNETNISITKYHQALSTWFESIFRKCPYYCL